MAATGLQAEVGVAIEEFAQKLRQLSDAHIESARADLVARERALDERERLLKEREQALDDRQQAIQEYEKAQREISGQAKFEVLKEVEQGLNLDQAMLKSSQPERAKAALMVPSPTRARSNIPTPPASANHQGITRTSALKPVSQGIAMSPRPRTQNVPPCSPPVCSPSRSPPVAVVASSPQVAGSPQPQPGNVASKITAISERKEKLLVALSSGGFQAYNADDSFLTNASMVSTPGRGSNVGPTRKSLAELLQEDEARLSKLDSR